MYGFNGLPERAENVTVFHAVMSGTTGNTGGSWQSWQKPQGVGSVYIFCMGSGGGGGGGGSAAGGTSRYGGGGGGGAAITFGIFPAFMLPDTLFVKVANGGLGGPGRTNVASGINGGPGDLSYVCIQPNTTAVNIVAQSGAAAAGGGGTNGAAGSAGTVWAPVTSNYILTTGISNYFVGLAGGAGGVTTPGNVTPTRIGVGGAGGGGNTNVNTSFAGGSVLQSGFSPLRAGGAATGQPGADGVSSFKLNSNMRSMSLSDPLYFTGGAGGGAQPTGGLTGGRGGIGSYGCGGGGGGASVYVAASGLGTGGDGGRGGDGIVFIIAW